MQRAVYWIDVGFSWVCVLSLIALNLFLSRTSDAALCIGHDGSPILGMEMTYVLPGDFFWGAQVLGVAAGVLFLIRANRALGANGSAAGLLLHLGVLVVAYLASLAILLQQHARAALSALAMLGC